jgi:hypothetical protein
MANEFIGMSGWTLGERASAGLSAAETADFRAALAERLHELGRGDPDDNAEVLAIKAIIDEYFPGEHYFISITLS